VDYRTNLNDRCPDCGRAAAVTYEREKNGEGKVMVSFPKLIACSNPQCDHYRRA